MNMKAVIFLFGSAFFHLLSRVSSFPYGAGACPKGIAATEAPGSPHNISGAVKGSLSDGGLVLAVNGKLVNGSVHLHAGLVYALNLSGSTFKGYLFRVDTAIPVISPNNAAACQTFNASGSSHTESSEKSSVNATLVFNETGVYSLDITAVKLFNNTTSVYYYDGFILNVTAFSLPALPKGTKKNKLAKKPKGYKKMMTGTGSKGHKSETHPLFPILGCHSMKESDGKKPLITISINGTNVTYCGKGGKGGKGIKGGKGGQGGSYPMKESNVNKFRSRLH